MCRTPKAFNKRWPGATLKRARMALLQSLPREQRPPSTRTQQAGATWAFSGTMLETLEGKKPKELGPASYFSIPGDVNHTTACKADAECIIYTDWQGAFD